MDDRKRRLGADDNASSVSSTAPRPPLKKRFTGTGPTNFSSPSSPVKAEPMQLVIDTNVLDVRISAYCSLRLVSSLASSSHVSLLLNSLKKNPSLPYCEVWKNQRYEITVLNQLVYCTTVLIPPIQSQAELHVAEERVEELESMNKSLGTSFFTIDVLWKMVSFDTICAAVSSEYLWDFLHQTYEDLKLMQLTVQSLNENVSIGMEALTNFLPKSTALKYWFVICRPSISTHWNTTEKKWTWQHFRTKTSRHNQLGQKDCFGGEIIARKGRSIQENYERWNRYE